LAYRTTASNLRIKTLAYYEKYKTKSTAIVVDKTDADPGVMGTVPIPVDADHISISKPANRRSAVYLSVCRHVKEFVEQAQVSSPAIATERAHESLAAIATERADREHGQTQDHMKVVLQNWASRQMGFPSTPNIVDKLGVGVFDKLSDARKNVLVGKWEGLERQAAGPDGQPIEYPVYLTIRWQDRVAKGDFRFVWSKEGVVLVDETLPFEGGFVSDRFLLLNFEDPISGKIQFGSLLLELSDDGSTLKGVDVGVGYSSGRIVTGDVEFRKKKAEV